LRALLHKLLYFPVCHHVPNGPSHFDIRLFKMDGLLRLLGFEFSHFLIQREGWTGGYVDDFTIKSHWVLQLEKYINLTQ